MPDRSDEFRRAASDCLYLARTTSDPGTRSALLTMAQRWFELADGPAGQAALDTAVEAFNDGQMKPEPVLQQQQQVQPNADTQPPSKRK
jgi:hypothetical protein